MAGAWCGPIRSHREGSGRRPLGEVWGACLDRACYLPQMTPDWPFDGGTDLAPPAYLGGLGRVFARFDARTQDSGNISFGVEAGGRRWFVKTAGDPDDPTPFLSHTARV